MNHKPMLARVYEYTDPRGWWMSEKLDGVRAIWTGTDFISRTGKVFPAPAEMRAAMPAGVAIDGELFGGRGKFQTSIGKIRRGIWDGITFKAFDTITEEPFEARQATLRALSLPAWCDVVEQVECASEAHLDEYEQSLIEIGAEGVMLRKPGSLYQHKRSSDLLKLKRIQSAEAEVIGYEQGKGKHAGRVGALVAKFAGQVFKLGTGLSNEQRDNPPAVGSMVTFSFFELTDGGLPRFASFVGVRDYE